MMTASKVIEKEFPKDNHLIILTDIVDKRRSLFKVIREVGTIIDCSVPKGERRADKTAQESVLFDRMKKILEQHEKTIDKDDEFYC